MLQSEGGGGRGEVSHVHNVFVLYVLNGVSRSVVTDNLYSFSNHLFIVLQVQNKVNMLMINPVSCLFQHTRPVHV